MPARRTAQLESLAAESLAIGDVASAAIFSVELPGTLGLVAAAGIAGLALDGLVAAVANPAHPVARAATDPGPTFDVRPMNLGGPALRSHLPLRIEGRTLGVLALAHESPLGPADRGRVTQLADRAASVLGRDAEGR